MKKASYWMALAHLPRWRTERINRLIVDILKEKKITFADFFNSNKDDWQNEFGLNKKEILDLENAKKELPNYSFLAENLINQGYSLIPIDSEDYSPVLKANLKMKYSPPLLYVKGNKQLMKENTVAIVGSRKASDTSLQFTKNIARKSTQNYQVVVSGFAKGVDKTALDETLAVTGQSIIVLPQGIMTFSSGFRKYYTQIVQGDVLVVSTFHPKVPWSVGLAMQRNKYIYNLSKTVYVAESDYQGGTWSGVLDGLRMNRKIYIRQTEPTENNANEFLMLLGVESVDMMGNVINNESPLKKELINILSSKMLEENEIIKKLQINKKPKNFSSLLANLDFIERIRRNKKNLFCLKKNMDKQLEWL